MAAAYTSSTLGERIRSSEARSFITLCKVIPTGALQARKHGNGSVGLFWRFTHQGKTDRVSIGLYDATLPPKSLEPKGKLYSIHAAIRQAEELAKRHLSHLESGGHRAVVAAEQSRRLAEQSAKEQSITVTLRALLEGYCKRLKDLRRQCAGNVTSLFRLHVFEAFPDLSSQPANTITEEQFADVLRSLFEAGKGRTANKLRSYLRAAYELARRARVDPTVPIHFKHFNVC
jgi:hypothetical protein